MKVTLECVLIADFWTAKASSRVLDEQEVHVQARVYLADEDARNTLDSRALDK